jgi:hypothetical protein
MATKKTTKPAGIVAETEAGLPDPYEMVEITTERAPSKGAKSFQVGINGTMYTIPYGKKQKVPRCVAQEIERSLEARAAYDAAAEGMTLEAAEAKLNAQQMEQLKEMLKAELKAELAE